MVVYRPNGPGPYPTVILNHGSTGNGDKPELFKHTWSSPELGRFFTAHGWQVLTPQRRGRGKSDGLYDEGFMPDRSRYTCEASVSLAGAERAIADLDAVVAHVRTRPDVDQRRLLVGGVSRGGVLSVAYAGMRPDAFLGVVNFVGGWMGDRCVNAVQINQTLFRRGAAFRQPVLWLYGDKDPFYSLRHSRGNHAAFIAAGGRGPFFAFDPPAGQTGHGIHLNPDLWRSAVESYLMEVAPR
jgi:dienelactone hydrolase